MTKIPFNSPPFVGNEIDYIQDAVSRRRICGDGDYTRKCNDWLSKNLQASCALLTTSCTHATEMAVMMSDVRQGDEVIMPSFSFVSTADAVVLRGAKPVFIDIRPDTMNIDENLIESAITDKTKAIILVHYAGVSCEMDTIMELAAGYGIKVIEDSAHAIGSSYKGKYCGTIGDYGCLSFHETKNVSCGEGGALLIRDVENLEKAEIIREKGTNRSMFYRGEIDKYTWIEAGSSYLPSEINAAYLYAQLEEFETIESSRRKAWDSYYRALEELENSCFIERPTVPEGCDHNGHMFYIKVRDIEERTRLIEYLRSKGISAAFHYVPLHSSPAGKRFGRFCGEDRFTTSESERLLRLPMFYGITEEMIDMVCREIYMFFGLDA